MPHTRISDPSGDDQETTDSEEAGTSPDTAGVVTGTTNEDASHPRTDTGTTNEDASHPRTDIGKFDAGDHPSTPSENVGTVTGDQNGQVPFYTLGGDQGQNDPHTSPIDQQKAACENIERTWVVTSSGSYCDLRKHDGYYPEEDKTKKLDPNNPADRLEWCVTRSEECSKSAKEAAAGDKCLLTGGVMGVIQQTWKGGIKSLVCVAVKVAERTSQVK
ncbi:hypothetical protein [Streptomyces virginiae]|uniref:hypothetical protein n=1 Tax=Streptomyces virginiae TaxID=1961 RepID=UPI00364C35A8